MTTHKIGPHSSLRRRFLLLTMAAVCATTLAAQAAPSLRIERSVTIAVATGPAIHTSGEEGQFSVLAWQTSQGVAVSLELCRDRQGCEILDGMDSAGSLTRGDENQLTVIATLNGIEVELQMARHARSDYYSCVDAQAGKVLNMQGLDVYWSLVSGTIGDWVVPYKTCGAWGNEAIVEWVSTS